MTHVRGVSIFGGSRPRASPRLLSIAWQTSKKFSLSSSFVTQLCSSSTDLVLVGKSRISRKYKKKSQLKDMPPNQSQQEPAILFGRDEDNGEAGRQASNLELFNRLRDRFSTERRQRSFRSHNNNNSNNLRRFRLTSFRGDSASFERMSDFLPSVIITALSRFNK